MVTMFFVVDRFEKGLGWMLGPHWLRLACDRRGVVSLRLLFAALSGVMRSILRYAQPRGVHGIRLDVGTDTMCAQLALA